MAERMIDHRGLMERPALAVGRRLGNRRMFLHLGLPARCACQRIPLKTNFPVRF